MGPMSPDALSISLTWQDITAVLIVAAAALYLLRHVLRALVRSRTSGCGGCPGCSVSGNPPLVTIQPSSPVTSSPRPSTEAARAPAKE